MREKFTLVFKSEAAPERFLIDEPGGYDAAVFKTDQKEGKFGRDNLSSGEKLQYRFTPSRNHKFDRLLYYRDRFGFRMKVSLEIELETGEMISYDVDPITCKTNRFDFFNCDLILDTQLMKIKRRRSTKVNVFSNKDLDGNSIEPLIPKKFLLKAKPLRQTSAWQAEDETFQLAQGFAGFPGYFNKMKIMTEFEIEDSLDWFEDFTVPPSSGSTEYPFPVDNFNIVKFKNNVNKLVAVFDLDLKTEYLDVEIPAAGATVRGYLVKGPGTFQDNIAIPENRFMFYYAPVGPNAGTNVYTYTGHLEIDLGAMNREDTLWFVFQHRATNYSQITKTTFKKAKLTLKADTVDYNTTTLGLRLYDVMKYVTKSICGLDISAEYFDENGYLYNQLLVTGNLLRNRIDKPVYITLEQIEKGLFGEFKCDYQLMPDQTIYFGLFPDFYRSQEIMFLPNTQFQDFEIDFNPRFTCKDLKFKFKRYQSQKENSTDNTAEGVHGESEWFCSDNDTCDNTHTIEVEWRRDAVGIEVDRRKSIDENNSTDTQDDDDISLLDVNIEEIENTNSLFFTENTFLQHTYSAASGKLTLRNQGEFSFLALGTTIGQPFAITSTPPQLNQGTYTVFEVSSNYIVLTPLGGTTPTSGNNGARNTRYTYFIDVTTIIGVSWTNQEITTDGFFSGENYANLRFSQKRDIENYHLQYLSTILMFADNKEFKNTFYKNNPNGSITYAGKTTVEGDPVKYANPILTPNLYKDAIFISSFKQYLELQHKIRTIRGFVRFQDHEGIIRKTFVKNLKFTNEKNELNLVESEEKYEPVIINIVTNQNGTLTINNEYTITKLKWEPKDQRIRIMDREGYLLYNPIFWNRIALNGAQPENLNQLKEWLQNL